MPSLNEYISTLRKYNPGITDRSITVYLLKDGWEIDKIEKAFRELNNVAEVITPGAPAASVIAPAPVVAAVASSTTASVLASLATSPSSSGTVSAAPSPKLASLSGISSQKTPGSLPSSPVSSLELEVQPVEVGGAISHPSFSDIVNKKANQTDMSASTDAVISTPTSGSTPSLGTYPSVSPVMPSSVTASIPKTSLQQQMEALVEEREHSVPQARAHEASTSIPTNITEKASSTSAYVAAESRPKFSYDEIMQGIHSPIGSKNPESPVVSINQVAIDSVTAPKSLVTSPLGEESKVNPVLTADEFVAPTKNPSVSYVGGSIVSGQGGSFGFAPSPISNTSTTPYSATGTRNDNSDFGPRGISTAPTPVTAYDPSASGIPPITEAQQRALLQMRQAGQVTGVPGSIPAANTTAPRAQSGMGKKIAWTIIILALLGVLVFGFMKYVYGVYLFANEPFEKEHFLKGFVTSIGSMKTSEYNMQVTVSGSAKSPDVEILDTTKLAKLSSEVVVDSTSSTAVEGSDSMAAGSEAGFVLPGESSLQGILNIIPSDASLTGGIRGIYDRTGNSKDLKLAINGSYVGDGVSIEADLESAKVGENVFIRVNKFPSFFLDLSSVKDKWVVFTRQDLIESGLGSFFGITEDAEGISGVMSSSGESTEAADSVKKQLAVILEIADTNKVLEVTESPKRIKQADKRVVYQYHVVPNLENFIAFAEQASSRLSSEYGDAALVKLTPAQINMFKSEAFAYYFKYLKSNSEIYIGVDAKGNPAFIHVSSKIALQSNDQIKQLNSDFKIEFSRVNESIKVETPAETIPYIDAYSQVTGKTKENILLEHQIGNVSKIQSAIAQYIRWTGTAPTTLADLGVSSAKLAEASTTFKALHQGDAGYYANSYIDDFSTSTRLLYAGSVKDAYSDNPLGYQKNSATTYTLTYPIKLPALPKQSYDLFTYVTFAKSSGTTYVPNPMMFLAYVNGVNTADSTVSSKEAQALQLKDTDKDKVSDSLEMYIGTNPNKSDTDGDGTNDYIEIRQASNPKGAGTWINMLNPVN